MVMLVAAGVGALLEAIPGAQLGLRIIGSICLLYLALRLAGSGVMKGGSVSKPLNVWEAGVFQFVNPKAWISPYPWSPRSCRLRCQPSLVGCFLRRSSPSL